MKSYGFADLVALSGASSHEVKHWVQEGLIRADVQETTGTGAHRAYGFLDVVESRVARKLNQQPGGMPIRFIGYALDAIRLESSLPDTPWRLFLDPATRTSKTLPLWLCLIPGSAPRVVDRVECAARLRDSRESVLLLRLDTLLLDLERRTQDHSTAAERDDAWMKRDRSIVESADPTTEPIANRSPGRRVIAAKSKD